MIRHKNGTSSSWKKAFRAEKSSSSPRHKSRSNISQTPQEWKPNWDSTLGSITSRFKWSNWDSMSTQVNSQASLIGSRYTRHLISSRNAIFMQTKTQNISLYGGRKIDRKQNSTSNCNYETLYWISHEFIAQRSRSEHFVSCSLRIFKCSLCSLNMCSLCVRIFSK